jgi:prevent-host-death family protein
MRFAMRSVNVAELKNRLSTYLTYAKGGEVVVIRDRNLPVAKLIPFVADDASQEELALVAAGAMRLPEKPLDLDQLWMKAGEPQHRFLGFQRSDPTLRSGADK